MSKGLKKAENWNYEETVAKVEEIIRQVESGQLSLEEVFDKFAVAVELLDQCEAFLKQGQERMNLLIETIADR